MKIMIDVHHLTDGINQIFSAIKYIDKQKEILE